MGDLAILHDVTANVPAVSAKTLPEAVSIILHQNMWLLRDNHVLAFLDQISKIRYMEIFEQKIKSEFIKYWVRNKSHNIHL